ncbi:cyanate permease [Paraburkholderia sp. BL23I1N1]|uniref:MFS transporter n=1 Tax=Paraburkholderia sp. BL23I1N1 TaxID=1938802 RepID=UPI000E721995|nr:MFS transporter [Paraburkholderia sp. BL23I1N1]RKE38662.1 cyanate permease [Paraburkholderia sp. BL23I1N1]
MENQYFPELEVPALAESAVRGASYWRSLIILAAATLGLAGGYTALFAGTSGVFLLPIASSLGSGRAIASSCVALSSLGIAMSSPFAGHLIHRYGFNKVIGGSIVLFVLSLLSLAVGPLIAGAVGLKVFALGLLGVATTPVGYLPILARSFERRLGLAFGIASFGAGVGAAGAPLLARWAIGQYGWQHAYAILAIVAAILGGISILFLSQVDVSVHSASAAQGPTIAGVSPDGFGMTLAEAFRTPQFWIISISIAAVAAVGLGSMVHIPALLVDRGATASKAAAGSAFAATGLTIGRFMAGLLLDLTPARILSTCVFFLGAVGAAILAASTQSTSFPTLAIAAGLTGMLVGAEGDLMPYLVKRYFGLKSFGIVYGFMISLFCIGTLAGPILFGVGYDKFHGYTVVMISASVLSVTSGLAIFLIGPYRYKS